MKYQDKIAVAKRLTRSGSRPYFPPNPTGTSHDRRNARHRRKTGGRRFARGALVLADGTVFEGQGFGAATHGVGEVCFNTAMTGYQEILTDPSYAGQIVCLHLSPYRHRRHQRAKTSKRLTPAVRGLVVRADAEHPSNYRALSALDRWLKQHNIPAHRGHRHARADQPHPRTRHAAWRDRAWRRTDVRRRRAA